MLYRKMNNSQDDIVNQDSASNLLLKINDAIQNKSLQDVNYLNDLKF